MRLTRPTLTARRLMALVAVAVATAGLTHDLLPPFGPSDPPIPTELPDESNRVRHPKGFSIILPPNWRDPDDDLGDGRSVITGRPRTALTLRTIHGLRVAKLGPDEPENAPEFQPVVFQGLPARERQAVEQISYERGPQFTYVLVFRREGCWYEIRYYHRSAQIRSLPNMIRRYLLTFKVDGRSSPGSSGEQRSQRPEQK